MALREFFVLLICRILKAPPSGEPREALIGYTLSLETLSVGFAATSPGGRGFKLNRSSRLRTKKALTTLIVQN